jgi:integrase
MPWITELNVEKVKEDGTRYTITKYRVGSFKNGRRKFKTFTNEKEAKAFSKTLGNLLLQKEYNFPGADGKVIPTFKKAAEKWFSDHVETNCKPSSIEGYQGMLDNHVLPAFGEMRLDEITKDAVRGFCAGKKKDGLASRSIRYMLATISGVYNLAIENGLVALNPASKPAKIIKVEDAKEKVSALSDEEARDLLKAAREHLPRFHPFLLTALRTGMRQGELVALEWSSIDWRGRFLEVGRSYRKNKVSEAGRSYREGVFSTTKSGKIRQVDMSDQTAMVLEGHRKVLAEAALKSGKPMPELVFPSTTWSPMDPSHIRRDFHAVLKKAGMRRVRFHDLRHTFASLLLRKGESPVYVQHQLGHHDISMTVSCYSHLIAGENRQAVNRLDDPDWSTKPATGAGTGNRMATGKTQEKQGVRLVCLTP